MGGDALGQTARPDALRHGGRAQAGGPGRDQLPVERLQVQGGIRRRDRRLSGLFRPADKTCPRRRLVQARAGILPSVLQAQGQRLLLVCGVDVRTPLEEGLAPFLYLFAAFVRQVVLLQRIFGEVEEFVGLVAVVVDVLLVALYARRTRFVVETAEHEGAVFGRLPQERIPWRSE